MTIQFSGPRPNRNLVRLFQRVAGVIAALVGLVFTATGVFLMISSGWASATGEVQSCRSQIVHTRGSITSGHVQHYCVVSWQADGRSHTATVTFTGALVTVGQPTQLKVDGDSATTPAPKWEGYAMAGLGIALLVGAGLAIFKRPRRPAQADAMI